LNKKGRRQREKVRRRRRKKRRAYAKLEYFSKTIFAIICALLFLILFIAVTDLVSGE